ncbi:hypothetical protein [Brevibacterium aurantiacum]|uniref:Uncharacterized protein n=1 Tax=Brevibacterium aurantiacum TaxID=273384 RepID=A0A2A3WWT3_BREAU|nr:hypothetical protein [Brevibacterium aurantiacum]PCC16854.1 hypothetical protein CIK79_00170 [Brevibacterium aurantiacum]
MDITEHTGGYAVAEVAELRTGAFTAEIHRDGRHVVDVENDGRGGCNYYSAVSPELRDEVQALHEYAARDFGDFEPADAFVEALIDIDTAEKNARRNGTPFSAEAEAMITAFKENAIPETIPYMESTFDLLRKIGAAKDAEGLPTESIEAQSAERATPTSGISGASRAETSSSIRRTLFDR